MHSNIQRDCGIDFVNNHSLVILAQEKFAKKILCMGIPLQF